MTEHSTEQSKLSVVTKPAINWLIILIGVVVGAAMLTGSYWAYNIYQPKQSEQPPVSTTKKATPSAKPATPSAQKDGIAGWKMYINKKEKFSFKIPQDIVVESKNNNLILFRSPDAVNLNYTEDFLEFSVQLLYNPSLFSPKEYLEWQFANVPESYPSSQVNNELNGAIRNSIKIKTIDHRQAAITISTNFEQPGIVYWIQNNDKIIRIGLSGGETGSEPTKKAERTFDQILSTFRFD